MSQYNSILLLGGTRPEASRLQRALSRHFLLVESVRDVEEARQLARRCRFHALVLVDPESPWERMRKALDECEELPPDVLIIIERNRAETAIDALSDGVCNALLRPVSNNELVAALIRAIDNRDSRQEGILQTETAPADDSTAISALQSPGEARAPAGGATPPGYPVDWTLEQVKRHHMIRVVDDSSGNKSAAARRLDISRKTLERKLGTGNLKQRR
ncbi:MAG: hypothetical protein MUO51_15955 [Woeseiaceae bacterium]|nr:hypothetical protein [Woeseiaceae bacterium]